MCSLPPVPFSLSLSDVSLKPGKGREQEVGSEEHIVDQALGRIHTLESSKLRGRRNSKSLGVKECGQV